MKTYILFLLAALISGCHSVQSNKTVESTLRSKVVQLQGNNHACSGTQIHTSAGANYILTAAHCEVLHDEYGTILASLDGSTRLVPRRILEVSPVTDLMLLEGMPGIEGVEVAPAFIQHQMFSTYNHGLHLATHRSDGEFIEEQRVLIPLFIVASPQEASKCNLPKYSLSDEETLFGVFSVCHLDIQAVVTFAQVDPGSSGGGVFDASGKLVGVVFAGDGHTNFLVTLKDIQAFVAPY